MSMKDLLRSLETEACKESPYLRKEQRGLAGPLEMGMEYIWDLAEDLAGRVARKTGARIRRDIRWDRNGYPEGSDAPWDLRFWVNDRETRVSFELAELESVGRRGRTGCRAVAPRILEALVTAATSTEDIVASG